MQIKKGMMNNSFPGKICWWDRWIFNHLLAQILQKKTPSSKGFIFSFMMAQG